MSETVRVPRDSFRFCRYVTAGLMWLGGLSGWTSPIVLVWVLMVVNAITGVGGAPLVVLYTHYIHPRRISPYEPLDVGSIRFSHTLAAVVIGVALLLLASGHAALAWRILWIMTLLKTWSCFFGCPGGKLYSCLRGKGGDCCRLTRRPPAA